MAGVKSARMRGAREASSHTELTRTGTRRGVLRGGGERVHSPQRTCDRVGPRVRNLSLRLGVGADGGVGE